MADAYAIIGLAKLKTIGNIQGMLAHMTRSRYTANSNGKPNTILIPPPTLQQIEERINSYMPRRNAVLAYDFLMTASPEFFRGKTEQEIAAWEQDSLAWCQKVFGPGNLIAAYSHHDESSIHITCTIIPEWEGKLCAAHFTDGRQKLRDMWTSYAQAMRPWGLKRGKLYSPAKHQAIKSYYSDVNQAKAVAIRGKVKAEQLPEPTLKDHAQPQEYAARLINYAIERLQEQNANLRTGLKAERQQREKAQAAAAKYKELYLSLLADPDGIRALEKALAEERLGRASDRREYEKLLAAVRDFFRKNIDKNSICRKPEALGRLLDFKEIEKDLRISLKPCNEPRQSMTLERT